MHNACLGESLDQKTTPNSKPGKTSHPCILPNTIKVIGQCN